MAEKNKAGLSCNRTSPLYNLNQQGYANFLHNQRLNETASPGILGSRVNQTDVSNTNNISFHSQFQLIWKKTLI